MKEDKNKFCETVATPNFPAYAIEAVSGRYVIVGGGGGAARTGIKNKFDVYELYHNGKQTTAERVVSHDVGSSCIGNMAGWCEVNVNGKCKTSPLIKLALGQDERCILLNLSPKLDSAPSLDDNTLLEDIFDEEPETTGPDGLRQRVQEKRPDEKKLKEMISKRRKQERLRRESINSTLRGDQYFTFDVDVVTQKETVKCYNKKNEFLEDTYQKAVRVSPDYRTLATGGTDGYVRLWSVPDFKQILEIKAHEKEVDDLDFRPDGKQIVSLCKPTRECCVWNVKDGRKFTQLALQTNGVKYKFYRARFCCVEKSASDLKLFTVSNAVVGSKHPGIIAKWNAVSYEQEKEADVRGTLSCLALSDNGRYLAAGTMDGGVFIFISFSLQMLRKVDDAHSVFVTSLSWLPTDNRESKIVRGFSEASVLSISCDNTLKIHHIPRQQMIPVWVVAILSVLVLFGAFVFASYLGL